MSNTSDDNQNDLINQFSDISGLDLSRSRLYLNSAGWNLDLALSSFYEEADENEMDQSGPQVLEELAPPEPPIKAEPKPEPKKTAGTKSSNSRIMTFSSLANDEPNEEEGQAFYAGGSERSGQQVIGPGKKKADDIVSEMFKAAKEHGAEVLDPDAPCSSKAKSFLFKGTGYKLGQNETDTEVVPAARSNAGRKENLSPREMVLRLWKDGFNVDDGAIRDYHDPANKEFLDSVVRGEIPRELVRELPGVEVSLSMEDHRSQAFQPSKKKLSTFAGEGHRLGNPTPDLVHPTSALPSDENGKCEGEARAALNVDDTQATTSIQIRLADGTRMVVKVNLSHTVGDIRRYISNAKPQFAAVVFVLMTTFPNKELDDDINIKDGNLMNAVIVQRLK